MDQFAKTPRPPYYAVIFTTIRTPGDKKYAEMSERMESEVKKQPGFLGFESARNEVGITVSYWIDKESIRNWRENSKHRVARKRGKEVWYEAYILRICKVEHDYLWSRDK